MKDPIVISLGGSIIVPDKIDTRYLKKFKKLILELSKTNNIIIVTGGGKVCRRYIQAANEVRKLKGDEGDWLGIQVTKLNAYLVKTIFGTAAHPEIFQDPTKRLKINKKIAIGAGWKPGASSDIDAVYLARTYNAKTIINLSNIEYIYDSDPRKNKNAKRCKELTWKQLQNIVGTKWTAGANYPFDPKATQLARKLNLTLYCLNGRKLGEVKKALQHKPFKGTVVEG